MSSISYQELTGKQNKQSSQRSQREFTPDGNIKSLTEEKGNNALMQEPQIDINSISLQQETLQNRNTNSHVTLNVAKGEENKTIP